MAQDAEIKLVLDTKEAIQEAKAFGPRLEKMLNVRVNNQGFVKLQNYLKDTLTTAGLLSEKTTEAGEAVLTLAKGFRTEGLKDYENKLTDIFKTVDAITENEKNLAEVQKQIAVLEGNEKGKSVKSLQGIYAGTKDQDKKAAAKITWENAKKQLEDAKAKESELLAQQEELNNTFDAQYKKVTYVCNAMEKVSDTSAKLKANVEVMEEVYTDLNKKAADTANNEQTAADKAKELGVHTKDVADNAEDADAAINKVTEGLGNATDAADKLKDKVAEASSATSDSATSATKGTSTEDHTNEIKELIQEIYNLKVTGRDASEQVTQLGRVLSTELGNKDRFDLTQLFLDTDEAIKYVKKDLEMSDLLRDEFNSVGDFFEQVRKKLNELNAEARKSSEPVVDATQEIEQNIQKINDTVVKIPTMKFDNEFDAKKNLDELKAAMKSIVDMGMPSQLSQQYNTLKKAIDDGKEAQKQFNQTASEPTAQQRLTELQNTIQKVTSTTARIDEAMKTESATNNIAELIRRLNELNVAKKTLEELNLPAGTDATYNKIIQLIAVLNGQVSDYKKQLTGVAEKHEKTKKSGTDFTKSVLSGVKSLKSAMSKLDRVGNKVKSSFNSMAHSMKSNFKHLITSITKYVLGFRSLFFLVRRLRKYIGEGIQNMAQFEGGNNHVNESITRLLSSLLYLKNAWATAFSPILQFVTPWLEQLIDSVARAGNAVSRFIGSLLGQENVFQAVKVDAASYADNLDKAAGSAGNAADKTKKLTDRLAAFDDLNVLGIDRDPDATGSGGGGGSADTYAPDPNEMFEIVNVGKEVLDKLKEMWDNADFTELGTTLRNKLLNALTEVSNNLDAFRDTAYNIGKSIITFFNGVFGDTSLWYSAGSTLGKAVNVVSEFVRGMLENNQVDWGGGLASLINSFFAATDWEMIRDNISNFVIEVKNNVISFLKTLNWTGDEGIFEAFKELGTAIGIAISETVGDAEFMGSLGDALGKLITAILITWKAILDQKDGDEIGNALYEFFASLIDAINWDTLAENLSGSFVLLLNAISKFSENLSEDDTFQQALSDFVENLDLDTIFEALARNISSSTVAANSVGEALVSVLGDRGLADRVAEGIGLLIGNLDYSKMLTSTVDFIGNLLASALLDPLLPLRIVGALISGLGNALGDKMIELAQSVEDEDTVRWFEQPGWFLVEGIVKGIGDAIESLFSAVASPFIAIEDAFCELFGIHSPSTVFEGYGENIIEGLKQGIENLIDTVMEPFTKLSTDLEDKWTEIKGNTYKKWVGIKNNVLTKAGEIKNSAEEKFDTLKTNLTNKWQEIKGAIYEKLVGIKLNMKEVFEQMGDAIKAPINTIIDIIEGMVNKAIDGINALTEGLGAITDLGSEIASKIGMPTIPHLGQLSHITIPHLAQGAVIPPNREFMAVLGDQSNGTNIEAPLDTIKQAVAEVLASNGNAEMIQLLQQLITVVENKNLVIGDKDIGKANARYVKQQNIVRGSTF